jgi:hypothetical protein
MEEEKERYISGQGWWQFRPERSRRDTEVAKCRIHLEDRGNHISWRIEHWV